MKIKKHTSFIILITAIIISLFIPQIIDFLYPLPGIFLTVTTFHKENLLDYYGKLLTFTGTIILGYIAWRQSKESSHMNREIMIQDLKVKCNSQTYIEKLFFLEGNIRMWFAREDEYIKMVKFKNFTIYTKYNGAILSAGRYEIPELNNYCQCVTQKYNDTKKWLLVNSISNFNVIKSAVESKRRIRLLIEMEVLNAFNVASTFKGEVMLNREEIQDRIGETIQSTYIFNTSDN
ncbi:MAG: hypothetical protein ABSG94_06490, partial [Brevinematales bacterium]